jgi:uncharacterized membrane protein (DUF485 family)
VFSKGNVGGSALIIGPAAFGILIYSITGHGNKAVGVSITVAMMTALGALAAAFLLGFLFGVPRAPSEVSGTTVRPSTNLEQIADWLTKILIGVGIGQFGNIGDALGRLNASVAAEISDPVNSTFAAGVLIYFGVFGFLAGWLVARIYVTKAVSGPDVEKIARRVVREEAATSAAE